MTPDQKPNTDEHRESGGGFLGLTEMPASPGHP
jgi:hypothetical protein